MNRVLSLATALVFCLASGASYANDKRILELEEQVYKRGDASAQDALADEYIRGNRYEKLLHLLVQWQTGFDGRYYPTTDFGVTQAESDLYLQLSEAHTSLAYMAIVDLLAGNVIWNWIETLPEKVSVRRNDKALARKWESRVNSFRQLRCERIVSDRES